MARGSPDPADGTELSVSCVLIGKNAKRDLRGDLIDCHEEVANAQIVGPQMSNLCPPNMRDPMFGHTNAIDAFITFLGENRDGGTDEDEQPKLVFVPREVE